MLRNLNKSSGGRRILGTPNVGLIASQIISETADGDNGAGLLYDEAIVNSGKQLRIHITSAPSSGSFFAYENGSFELTGAPDGAYSIGYQYYLDNVLGGSDTATVNIGSVNASVVAGAGAGAGSGTGGAATGTQSANANVPAGQETMVGSGSGGDAVGMVIGSGIVPAGTGTAPGFGYGGAANNSSLVPSSRYKVRGQRRNYRVS